MSEIYKDGQQAQINDSVMGLIDGAPARGKVLRLGKDGKVLIERVAPYERKTKPRTVIHDEVDASTLTLVYRKAVPAAPSLPAEAPAKAKPAKAAAKKENAKT